MVAPIYPYRLGQTDTVVERITEFFAHAGKAGKRDELAAALSDVVHALRMFPSQFGDPLFSTIQDGGTVFHRITTHLAIRYVVFEKEKIVVWLKLAPFDNYWDTQSSYLALRDLPGREGRFRDFRHAHSAFET